MRNYSVTLIALMTLVFCSYKSASQNIFNVNCGDDFTKWQSYFTLKSHIDNDNSNLYEYSKPISNDFFHHRVEKFFIGVKGNIVVKQIYILLPNTGEVGVPQPLIKEMEYDFGKSFHVDNLKFGEHDGYYGAKVDNITVKVHLDNNSITSWKDRLTIYIKAD